MCSVVISDCRVWIIFWSKSSLVCWVGVRGVFGRVIGIKESTVVGREEGVFREFLIVMYLLRFVVVVVVGMFLVALRYLVFRFCWRNAVSDCRVWIVSESESSWDCWAGVGSVLDSSAVSSSWRGCRFGLSCLDYAWEPE